MRKKLAALFKNRKAAAGLTAVLLAVAVGGTAESGTGTSILYGSDPGNKH